MKKLIYTFYFFTATASFACPNLAGNYICKTNEQGPFPVLRYQISQSKVKNEMSYHFQEKRMTLNNKVTDLDRTFVDGVTQLIDNEYVSGFEEANCKGDALVVLQNLTLKMTGETSEFAQEYSLNSNGNLVIKNLDKFICIKK